jgi:S1-C subfamily serine protease
MNPIFSSPAKKKKEQHKQEYYTELASSLDEFINSFYWGKDMNPTEAKRNVEHGVVEIISHCCHSSNGLLITEDGYFITAKHCLSDVHQPQIRLYDGLVCDVEKICVLSKKRDVAIAKANKPGECKPVRYKFFDKSRYEEVPVVTLTMREGRLIKKTGIVQNLQDQPSIRIDDTSLAREDHFVISFSENIPGDSGGIVIGPYSEIIGIAISGQISSGKPVPAGYSSAVKLVKVLESVHIYSSTIKERFCK